jgi:hypothetical protein
MNTKHTPGPWTYMDHSQETSAIFAGEDRDLIADARTVADARLIAAAPELLAALQTLADELESRGIVPPCLTDAKRVIAKAVQS